jgi:hypothetical protein
MAAERLGQTIEGAEPPGLAGGVLAQNAGCDNDRHCRVGTFEDFEKGQPVHARPNDVADYSVEAAPLGQLQSFFGCRRSDRVDACHLAQNHLEYDAHARTIVHDED